MARFSFPLTSNGPLVEVLVSVTASRHYVLSRFQLPIPEPVRVRALIETGAAYSCCDLAVFSLLNLVSTYEVSILTPGTGAVPQQMKQYEVDVTIVASQGQITSPFKRVADVEASLAAQGVHALIGRGILDRCLFLYDGPNATFSLSL